MPDPITIPRSLGASLVLVALCFVPSGGPSAAPAAGTIEGTITVREGGKARADASRVVVYLDGVTAKGTGRKHSIRQHGIQFDPPLSVITKGTTVSFPNDDKVFHNVFSTSRPARFDLGLYRSGASKSVEFKRAGVVDIFCNIHPDMVSRVVVVDSPHHTMTDAKGAFTLAGIAPGTYTIVAQHAYGEPVRGEVTVEAGKPAAVSLEVESGRAPRQHRRKDGTPYGRYE
jgi:plastocyanin